MSIKSILHVFGGEAHELNALSSALALARVSRAFVRILHIAPPPILPATMDIMGYAVVAAGDASIIDVLEKDARDRSDRASAYARDYCRREEIALLADGASAVMGQAHAAFRVVTGVPDVCLIKEAYTADLVISGYSNRPDVDLQTVLTSLFNARRPILLLPRVPGEPLSSTGFARTIVFAWDGSRAAAQALREAVPHMLHAKQVFLLRIASGVDQYDDIAESDVLTYLHSHCIKAEFVHVAREGRSVGAALLHEASVLEADLLAMGAYGQSHIGEMVLGGATDHVLKHSRLPLLLAR